MCVSRKLRPLIGQGLLPAVVFQPFSRQSSSLAIWGEVVSGKRCSGLHSGPLQTVGLIPWLVLQLGVHVTAPSARQRPAPSFPCSSLCVYPHPASLPPCLVSFAAKPVVPLWFAFVALFSIPWCSSLLEFPMQPCSLSSSPITVYNTHVCSLHLQVLSKIHVESKPHACLCRLSFWLKAGCVYQGALTLPHAGSGSEYSGLSGPPQVLLPIVATLSPPQLLNSTRLECLSHRKTGVGFAF